MNLFDALSAASSATKKPRKKLDSTHIRNCVEYMEKLPAGTHFSKNDITTITGATRPAAEAAIREMHILGRVVDTGRGVKRYIKKNSLL